MLWLDKAFHEVMVDAGDNEDIRNSYSLDMNKSFRHVKEGAKKRGGTQKLD
ncbi:hypothetical protein BSBH6_03305 [Bacillus subtilis]|nr:hypothetical protein BSBH6_03305 [Bacillus subtilis]RPK22500.1 hypothetical protein BH5_03311 [Bacillus subtilis]